MAHGFYGVLGLRPGASETHIRTAFNDMGLQEELSKKTFVSLAFFILSNRKLRRDYDIAHGFYFPRPQGVRAWLGDVVDPPPDFSLLDHSVPHPIVPKASPDDDISDQMHLCQPPCLDSHRYRKQPRRDNDVYTCFGAASAGCLDCVKYLIEVRGVSDKAKSEGSGYTIADFAEWELRSRKGKRKQPDTNANHEGVIEYLRMRAENDEQHYDRDAARSIWSLIDHADM